MVALYIVDATTLLYSHIDHKLNRLCRSGHDTVAARQEMRTSLVVAASDVLMFLDRERFCALGLAACAKLMYLYN